MSNPSGRNLLLLIKSTGRSGAPCLSLPVGIPVAAVLRPVATELDAQNGQDVLHLTEWRNNHVESFLTEFLATPSQTRRWLAKTVGPSDSRILFMLDRLDGKSVGYMGLAFIDWASGYAEADAVVRGCPAQPRLMGEALRTMLSWAESQLSLRRFGVRVRSDNPAIGFYKKLDFSEVKRVPLRKHACDGVIRWEEDASIAEGDGPSLVHMRWKSD
jgi:RimJ/RimL family protein N-acetyltransferase